MMVDICALQYVKSSWHERGKDMYYKEILLNFDDYKIITLFI